MNPLVLKTNTETKASGASITDLAISQWILPWVCTNQSFEHQRARRRSTARWCSTLRQVLRCSKKWDKKRNRHKPHKPHKISQATRTSSCFDGMNKLFKTHPFLQNNLMRRTRVQQNHKNVQTQYLKCLRMSGMLVPHVRRANRQPHDLRDVRLYLADVRFNLGHLESMLLKKRKSERERESESAQRRTTGIRNRIQPFGLLEELLFCKFKEGCGLRRFSGVYMA